MSRFPDFLGEMATVPLLHLSPLGRGRREAPGEGALSVGSSLNPLTPTLSPMGRGSPQCEPRARQSNRTPFRYRLSEKRLGHLLIVAALLVTGVTALAEPQRKYGVGREATPQEVAGWDIDVRPDGQGLPAGKGSVKDGEATYLSRCAACHGEFGEGAGRWPPVAGGRDTLASHDPNKTVGSYFPYLSTLFDYTRHAMPFGDSQSLTNDELYAVVAYVLWLNDIVEQDFVLSQETWSKVKMPNSGGFYEDDRETTEKAFWNPTPCMNNCKADVTITGRARAIDVTPEDDSKRSRNVE
jgi:S-disulfanyl-L-cysteine oxidoreductase SoxD